MSLPIKLNDIGVEEKDEFSKFLIPILCNQANLYVQHYKEISEMLQ